MENIETALKQARMCRTKQSWECFFSNFGHLVSRCTRGKEIAEIYRLLRTDSNAIRFSADIWVCLLEGCLSSWNLELGLEIVSFTKVLPSERVALCAAKVAIEAGIPLDARALAQRALRLKNVSAKNTLELEVIVCRTYVEVGERSQAIRFVNKAANKVKLSDLGQTDKIEFIGHLARCHFFLGQYANAAKLFAECAQFYIKEKNWPEAARLTYNAGSSFFNAGSRHRALAFHYIEECRKIAVLNGVVAPLSHIEAFYGHNEYWKGNFSAARDYYRKAYANLPKEDKSFRTLHVLSMLAIVYFRMGQFKFGKNYAKKTLNLAQNDSSGRFRHRYDTLHSELLWEEGKVSESQSLIKNKVTDCLSNGINTLEDVTMVARYLRQSAEIREFSIAPHFPVSENLKKDTGDWIEFCHARAYFLQCQDKFGDAFEAFSKAKTKAKNQEDKYHLYLTNIGQFICRLNLKQMCIESAKDEIKHLQMESSLLGDGPHRNLQFFIQAGLAFRDNDKAGVIQHLKMIDRAHSLSFSQSVCHNAWIKTIQKSAVRFGSPLEMNILATYTKLYFNPKVSRVSKRLFLISDLYDLDLRDHPALGDILEFLWEAPNLKASLEEIQTKVWGQSLGATGWEQKIRNSLRRLRQLTSASIAPLIVTSGEIRIFSEAFCIDRPCKESLDASAQVLSFLQTEALSSHCLANKINLSSATTKRILKKLTEQEEITRLKVGRQVLYLKTDNTSSQEVSEIH